MSVTTSAERKQKMDFLRSKNKQLYEDIQNDIRRNLTHEKIEAIGEQISIFLQKWMHKIKKPAQVIYLEWNDYLTFWRKNSVLYVCERRSKFLQRGRR